MQQLLLHIVAITTITTTIITSFHIPHARTHLPRRVPCTACLRCTLGVCMPQPRAQVMPLRCLRLGDWPPPQARSLSRHESHRKHHVETATKATRCKRQVWVAPHTHINEHTHTLSHSHAQSRSHAVTLIHPLALTLALSESLASQRASDNDGETSPAGMTPMLRLKALIADKNLMVSGRVCTDKCFVSFLQFVFV